MSRFFPCLAAVIVMPWLLPANEPAPDRAARALFFQRPPGVPATAVLVHGKGTITIGLPAMHLSEPIRIPGGDIILSVLGQPPPDASTPLPRGAPQVAIPAAWESALLLFFHDPANKTFPARVLPVDGSAIAFKPGTMLWMNLSKSAVGGTLGDLKFHMAPGKTLMLKPPRDGNGDYAVAVDFKSAGQTVSRPLCRTTWRHDPEIRQLVFITSGGDRPAPRIWSVEESIRAPAPANP